MGVQFVRWLHDDEIWVCTACKTLGSNTHLAANTAKIQSTSMKRFVYCSIKKTLILDNALLLFLIADFILTGMTGNSAAVFTSVANVECSVPYIKQFTTGIYRIAHIHCTRCTAYVGWRYVDVIDCPEWQKNVFKLQKVRALSLVR